MNQRRSYVLFLDYAALLLTDGGTFRWFAARAPHATAKAFGLALEAFAPHSYCYEPCSNSIIMKVAT
jgi:hypothetical protein